MCNVLYKIISKVLVNRLKSHLPHIVAENQNAFISGKLISDIVVAHEIFHSLKSRKRQANSYISVKTDSTKNMIALNGDLYRKQYSVWDIEKSGFGGSWLAYLSSPIQT